MIPPSGLMSKFLVFYDCAKTDDPVIRAVEETDVLNAILAARADERTLTGGNCPLCVLTTVRIIG